MYQLNKKMLAGLESPDSSRKSIYRLGGAAAASDTQRAIIAAAGEAIATKGADFTPGSFIGFFLTEIAGLAFSLNMLKGRIFSRVAAYSGIVGFGFLIIFTVWVTFLQVLFDAAMIIAAVGGILSLLWYLLVALRLFQVAKELDS